MSQQPPLPIIGSQDWGDDLNNYLAALDARTAVLENTPKPTTTHTGEWSLSATVTPPPAANQLRADTGVNLKQASKLWFADISNAGVDWTNIWTTFPVGTIHIYIQDKNEANKWVKLDS